MDKTDKIVSMYDKYIMDTYKRVPLCLEKARGAKVWDIEGKEYLDFFPGWAVSGIGHCHPRVIAAINKQSKKLLHVSNNYYSEPQAKVAEAIIKNSYPGKVFFANSGAEANEAAVKLAEGNKASLILSAEGRQEAAQREQVARAKEAAVRATRGRQRVGL